MCFIACVSTAKLWARVLLTLYLNHCIFVLDDEYLKKKPLMCGRLLNSVPYKMTICDLIIRLLFTIQIITRLFRVNAFLSHKINEIRCEIR